MKVTAHFEFTLTLLLLLVTASASAAETWKVTNKGTMKCRVRIRPASNRNAGFTPTDLEPGDRKEIALSEQGSFDLNIQFFNAAGKINASWTADQPVDLRKRMVSEEGENLMVVAKQDAPRRGPDGKMVSVAWRVPILSGMQFRHLPEQLERLGVVNNSDPAQQTLNIDTTVSVGDRPVAVRLSGEPDQLSIAVNGDNFGLEDVVVQQVHQQRYVVSGRYSGGDRTGDFILEMRNEFPFNRMTLEIGTGASGEWNAYELRPSMVAVNVPRPDVILIDKFRDISMETQRSQKEDLQRLEDRLKETETRLNDRLAELELRLTEPNLHRIAVDCVQCHQSKPNGLKGPKRIGDLLNSIPNMNEDRMREMVRLSELNDQRGQLLIDYVRQFNKPIGK